MRFYFSIDSGEEFRVLKGHPGRILTTAFSSDMCTIATVSVSVYIQIVGWVEERNPTCTPFSQRKLGRAKRNPT